MANYFQVVNPSGSVLVDDTTARLALRRIVTLSSSYEDFSYTYKNDNSDSYYKFYKVPMQTGEVICFAHSNNSSQPITCFNADSSHCVAIFYTVGSTVVPGDVKLYIFGTPVQVDPHTGLAIYNADGALIFSSEQQILYKFKGVFSTTTTWNQINASRTTSISTGIGSGETAVNAPCYIGQGAGNVYDSCIYPILFTNTLTLSIRWLYSGYTAASGSKLWDWSRCGPVGLGCTMTAIDISRYPTNL